MKTTVLALAAFFATFIVGMAILAPKHAPIRTPVPAVAHSTSPYAAQADLDRYLVNLGVDPAGYR